MLAVPESWLVVTAGKLLCYFPKINAMKMIAQEAPVKADWKSYEVRKISTKVIHGYDKALRKETEAKFTSGIDTDDDDQPAIPKTVKRRRVLMETNENPDASGKYVKV